MRGKPTNRKIINEIDWIRKNHWPAEIVRMMHGQLPRRTVYRILANLKAADEVRKMEFIKRQKEIEEQEEIEQLERMLSLREKRFKSTAQFSRNLRRVRSF